jgi:hypothetical protein
MDRSCPKLITEVLEGSRRCHTARFTVPSPNFGYLHTRTNQHPSFVDKTCIPRASIVGRPRRICFLARSAMSMTRKFVTSGSIPLYPDRINH